MQKKLHQHERADTCGDIIEHDSSALWKFLQLAHRRRLDDIERSKKYKTGEKSFPRDGDGDKRNQLPGDLVDHHKLWVLHA